MSSTHSGGARRNYAHRPVPESRVVAPDGERLRTAVGRALGAFRTGDIGAWDDDGRLAIVGRAKELIISGGDNVYPREVEDALESSPLASAAVFGITSAEWGEEIAAAVVPADPAEVPTLELLQQHGEPLLARYKCPRRLVVVTKLPRNAMEKPARNELRSLL